jgi:hypothetical protein
MVTNTYRPADGLFKPKHITCFTLYCEMCKTTWKKKYIDNPVWGPHHKIHTNQIQHVAIRYGLDGPGIESRWGRDFLHMSRIPYAPPILLYNGHQFSFSGAKRWERSSDHPIPSSVEVKERVELHFYSTSCPLWSLLG